MVKQYCTPLAVSLVAIAAMTAVSAATTSREAHAPDPATTGAFVELAKRTGGTNVVVHRSTAVHQEPAAVIAPAPPRD